MECLTLTLIDDNIVEFVEFIEIQLNFFDFRPGLVLLNTFHLVVIIDDEGTCIYIAYLVIQLQ